MANEIKNALKMLPTLQEVKKLFSDIHLKRVFTREVTVRCGKSDDGLYYAIFRINETTNNPEIESQICDKMNGKIKSYSFWAMEFCGHFIGDAWTEITIDIFKNKVVELVIRHPFTERICVFGEYYLAGMGAMNLDQIKNQVLKTYQTTLERQIAQARCDFRRAHKQIIAIRESLGKKEYYKYARNIVLDPEEERDY